jgi:hypothetical protein
VQFETDLPEGRPSFRLTSDQIATVIKLVCSAVTEAALHVTPEMPEVPITRILRKSMRRLRQVQGLTNLDVHGEVEIDDMTRFDESLLGRIDITLKFMHQFGDEDAFVSIECKRVGSGMTTLNRLYVSEGVVRFATARYAKGTPTASCSDTCSLCHTLKWSRPLATAYLPSTDGPRPSSVFLMKAVLQLPVEECPEPATRTLCSTTCSPT